MTPYVILVFIPGREWCVLAEKGKQQLFTSEEEADAYAERYTQTKKRWDDLRPRVIEEENYRAIKSGNWQTGKATDLLNNHGLFHDETLKEIEAMLVVPQPK
jgi:predicted nuclease with TOPRIM domain